MNKILAKAQDKRAELLNKIEGLIVLNDIGQHGARDGKYDEQYLALKTELDEAEATIKAQEIIQKQEQNSSVTYTALEQHVSGSQTAGAELSDGGFANVGEFFAALYRKDRGEGFDERLRPLAVVDTTTGSSGGFAMPVMFVVKTFQEGLEDTILLNSCDKQEMTADTCICPTWPDENHSTSSPYGISWFQVPESGDFTETTTKLGGLKLEAKKSGAMIYISNEWLRAVPMTMSNRIEEIFRSSLRHYIEGLLWNGNGSGQALGALVAPGSLEVAKQATQAVGSATIVTENIVNMWARLKPGSHSRSIWVCNQTALPQLSTLTMNVGTGGSNVGILNPETRSVSGAPSMGIFGRPLYMSEHLPVVGTAGDICLLDPMMYLFGDRLSIIVDTSAHYRFLQDQTAFRPQARFDAQPVLRSVITPENGDTCAWLVKIADR